MVNIKLIALVGKIAARVYMHVRACGCVCVCGKQTNRDNDITKQLLQLVKKLQTVGSKENIGESETVTIAEPKQFPGNLLDVTTAHGKSARLHLRLVLAQLSGLLLLASQKGLVLFPTGAALLDTVEEHTQCANSNG